MNYIVLEVQTNSDGTVGTIVNSYANRNQAESAYHSILASAALSTLPKHCAFLLDDLARTIKSEMYEHSIIIEEVE